MTKQERTYFWFVVILITISRIPFLFYGYGSEEDAWALPLVAERIALSGNYEVSRLPGHPFQEIVFSLIWNSSSILFNLLTVLISTSGIACFMLFLRNLNFKHWLITGIAIAVTPIIYINSTNDMDYMWALGFILIAFYFTTLNKPIIVGLFLACAIGCRITSGAMIIPLLILTIKLSENHIKTNSIIKIIVSTIFFTVLIFIPVFKVYGLSFFTFYEHFPIPSIIKNIYKGTIAVWGIIGVIALLLSFIIVLRERKTYDQLFFKNKNISTTFLLCCTIIVTLYSISFIRMPLKAAFMIPLVPFVWAGLSILVSTRIYKVLIVLIFISTFSFGINLSDSLRGSKESSFSIHKNIGGQHIVIDPFFGLLMADITKRQQRTSYAISILEKTKFINKPTFIIAGWWLADILVLQRGKENKLVQFAYYTEEKELVKYKQSGFELYYLPEQNEFNDLRFKKSFTTKYAIPF